MILDMDPSVIQPPETKKNSVFRKRTNKAPSVKNAVVARRASGQSNSKIARDLGIAVNTVKSIANLTDIDKILEDQAFQSAKLIPEAIRVAGVRLAKDSENMAIKVLENTIWPMNERLTGTKRMTGDVTLNQTLQVLLRSDSPIEGSKDENLKSIVINAPSEDTTK